MSDKINHLPKEKWQGHLLPIEYKTDEYYHVDISQNNKGYHFVIEKKQLDQAITCEAKDHDFPDSLYQEHWEDAFAWGIVEDNKLVGAIETVPESWSNRLRITELWLAPTHQKKGYGRQLIDVAKEQLRKERRRALILETQSCNVNAIDFYRHCGFRLVGLDICAYSNDDINNREVRLEFAWFPMPKQRLTEAEVDICIETAEDYYQVEHMTQRAFWNNHHLGCDEHYLVHNLRQDAAYLPQLSRIARKDGEVIGAIFYSKATVVDDDKVHDVLTFGPLCVAPEWQGCGVGEMLVNETKQLAKQAGYKGIIIFGEPDYYPRLGFKSADHYGIATADGKNFAAFMALELSKGSLNNIKGKFYNAKVFEDLPKEAVEAYNKKFPPMHKLKYLGHWD